MIVFKLASTTIIPRIVEANVRYNTGRLSSDAPLPRELIFPIGLLNGEQKRCINMAIFVTNSLDSMYSELNEDLNAVLNEADFVLGTSPVLFHPQPPPYHRIAAYPISRAHNSSPASHASAILPVSTPRSISTESTPCFVPGADSTSHIANISATSASVTLDGQTSGVHVSSTTRTVPKPLYAPLSTSNTLTAALAEDVYLFVEPMSAALFAHPAISLAETLSITAIESTNAATLVSNIALMPPLWPRTTEKDVKSSTRDLPSLDLHR